MLSKINNGYWVFGANLIQSAVSVVTLLLIIRLGSQEDVGNYSFAQGVLLPFQLFFTLKLRTIQCADHESRFSYAQYHNVRRLAAGLNFICTFIVICFFFDGGQRLYIGLFLLVSYTILLLRESYVSQLLLKRDGQGFFYISLINGAVSVFAFLVIYIVSRNLIWAVAGVALVRGVSYVCLEKKIVLKKTDSKECYLEFEWWSKPTSSLVSKSWPLGVTALLGALFTTVPRIVVDHYEGAEALGVFTAITSLLFFFNLLVNSFIQSALPSMALAYSMNNSDFNKKVFNALGKVVVIGLLCSIFVFWVGDYLLWFIFGPEYRQYKFELMWVTVSVCFLAIFSIGNLMLSSQQNFYIQFPIYGLVAFVIATCSVMGAQMFGMVGVLAGQSAGYLVGFLMCYLSYCKYRCEGKV